MTWGTPTSGGRSHGMVLAVLLLPLLLVATACGPAAPELPPEVQALDVGARWTGARSDLSLGEALDLTLWVVARSARSDDKKPADERLPQGTLLTRKSGPEVEGARLEPTGETQRQRSDDKLSWSRTYRLTWLRLGEQRLPPFEIQVTDGGEKLSTQSLDFEVAGVLRDTDTKSAEIPIELLQDPPTSWLTLYLVLGGVLIAVFVGWWLQRRLKGEMHAVDSGPVIPAIDQARASLARIEADWRAQALDGEALVVAVSAVLRTYLQKGLGFHSLTHTTEEFLDELRGAAQVPMTLQTPMQAFLQQCDLIKFAAQGTDMALCNSLLEKTRELVEEAAHLPVPDVTDGPTGGPTGGSAGGRSGAPASKPAVRKEAVHGG